jgi:hypothetical protein
VNGYIETYTGRLLDLKKIASVDVIRMSEVRLPDPERAKRWDDALSYHRWDVVVTMDDGELVTYLEGAACQSEDNPCYTEADRELSEDERNVMTEVAEKLLLEVADAKENT